MSNTQGAALLNLGKTPANHVMDRCIAP